MCAADLPENNVNVLDVKPDQVSVSSPLFWHKSAPKAVRINYAAELFTDGWAAWQSHLKKRGTPADPAELTQGGKDAVYWTISDDKNIQTEGMEPRLLAALDALARCRAMPKLAADLPAEQWWAELEQLLARVSEAENLSLADGPLMHQLLRGELALTLAYCFPEINSCRQLAQSANLALSWGIQNLLDGEGFPHARHLPLLGPLLACWTRCRSMGDGVSGGCWTSAAEEQYQLLVRNALRLARPDGATAFCQEWAGSYNPDLFAAALKFNADRANRRIAEMVLPRFGSKAPKKTKHKSLPSPAVHSPWAEAAVFRPEWSRKGERLTVLYPGKQVQLELSCGEVLLRGPWELEVRLDDRLLDAESDWEETCWVSDEDVDYLELEIRLAEGFRVQRHITFARQDRVMLLADAVLGQRSGQIDYSCTLPLCRDVVFNRAEETREGILNVAKPRVLVVPLALPQRRGEEGIGQFEQRESCLELAQSREGCRMFTPLWFDFDRRRMSRPLLWRQLTVGESLRNQSPDVAVGYRIQVGNRQWLVYRSLAEPANRTLLGHNLSTEMLLAQFGSDGEVEPLIEIE
jgi:hypothetical protein